MIREDILDCAATIKLLRTLLGEARAMIATDDIELQEKDATIEQLKEKVDRFAAFSRRDLARAEKAIRERDIALGAINVGRFDV